MRELGLSKNMINPLRAKVLTDNLLYSNNCHTLEDVNLSGNLFCVTDTAVKLLHHDNIKHINLTRVTIYIGQQRIGLSGWGLVAMRSYLLPEKFNSCKTSIIIRTTLLLYILICLIFLWTLRLQWLFSEN